LRLEIGLPQTEQYDEVFNNAGLDVLEYAKRWRKYRINLTAGEINKHRDTLERLLRDAY
jgi:hypothetical protein